MNAWLRLIPIFFVSWLAVGCIQKTASPSPAAPSGVGKAEALPSQSAIELIRLSGVGAPYISEPIHLVDDSTLLVHWDQSSQGEFSFRLAAPTAGPASPAEVEVVFEYVLGPSSGSGDDAFPAGDYLVSVTAADGPWLIWIERVDTVGDGD